jgi:hypothetical protein
MKNLILREYDQPTTAPVPKVAAVGQVGAAITAFVTLLALTGIIIPDGLAKQAEAAIQSTLVIVTFLQALIQFLAGYLKRDAKPFPVVQEIKKLEEKEKNL